MKASGMEPSGREWWRVVLPLAVVSLMSGCYVATDEAVYPEGKHVQEASLLRKWTAQGVELALKENDAFSAAGLKLEYFECSSDGVRKKSGSGSWSTAKGSKSTYVLLTFEDGCSATLWAGESEGKTVLWATQTDENEVLTLRS